MELFGDHNLLLKFVAAFVFVLLLIGMLAWAVRRLGAARQDAAARGRQPRLAVVDSAAVDGRRKLVIVRRDNVEHLLMIGGPTDVVVETSIVRASATAAREAPAVRSTVAEPTMPRAVPLPDPTWAPQPEPAAPAAPERQRPVVAASAEDGSLHRPRFPEAPAPALAPVAPVPTPAPARQPRRAEPFSGLATELARPAPEAAPAAAKAAPARPTGPRPILVPSHDMQQGDQNLADMAHRLEAALRRPTPQPAKPLPESAAKVAAPAVAAAASAPTATVTPAVSAPAAEPARAEPKSAPVVRVEPRPISAAKGGAQPKPALENLEQEMASLLGRPGKT